MKKRATCDKALEDTMYALLYDAFVVREKITVKVGKRRFRCFMPKLTRYGDRVEIGLCDVEETKV